MSLTVFTSQQNTHRDYVIPGHPASSSHQPQVRTFSNFFWLNPRRPHAHDTVWRRSLRWNFFLKQPLPWYSVADIYDCIRIGIHTPYIFLPDSHKSLRKWTWWCRPRVDKPEVCGVSVPSSKACVASRGWINCSDYVCSPCTQGVRLRRSIPHNTINNESFPTCLICDSTISEWPNVPPPSFVPLVRLFFHSSKSWTCALTM